MSATALTWAGLSCSLAALAIQVFPNAAFRMGIDVGAAWLMLGFGVFLIAVSVALNIAGRGDRRL